MRPTEYLQTNIDSLTWLAGNWVGKVGEDDVQEVWALPMNGSLLGMFRWFRDGKIRIIEIITIANFEGATWMKFKHLDERLVSWEEKSETTDFILVEATANTAVFIEVGKRQWLIYEREDEKLTVHFERDDGPPAVAKPFEYNLAPIAAS